MQLNWFDLLAIAVVVVGILRGKKRGMSEELLDVLQWLLVVVVGAMLYKPVGNFIATHGRIGYLAGHMIGYAMWLVVFVLLFALLKRAVGEKLVHSDAFGALEYYLGMIAGAFRYACILLFAMALLHAVYISPAERERQAVIQKESFGSVSFPTIASLQHTVFSESAVGKFVEAKFGAQLIDPISSSGPVDSIGTRRTRLFEEAGQ
ncbi:MAG TPA: CvpA family protein [Methylomirabilota bacterium]|nr:CvpA family protein [Methylomirabilota bacterium]